MDTLYFSTLIVCLATSVVTIFNGYTPTYIKAMAVLMSVIAFVEFGSLYHIFPTIHHSNHWIYNVESVFEFYFFSYFFLHILSTSFNKQLIRFFVVFYPVILFISFLTIQKYYIFHTYTYILGELYLILLCLLFYRELYTSKEFKKLSTLPEFWIVTGLFIFSAGELPYMILLNYLNTHFHAVSTFFKEYILGTLNVVMYLMFTIGLLWSLRIKK